MIKTSYATWACLMGLALASPAMAQSTTRCGGLLCDVYYGVRPAGAPDADALPCNDFVCRVFGHKEQPVVAVAAPLEPAATPVAMPKVKRKHKKIAAVQPAPATPN